MLLWVTGKYVETGLGAMGASGRTAGIGLM